MWKKTILTVTILPVMSYLYMLHEESWARRLGDRYDEMEKFYGVFCYVLLFSLLIWIIWKRREEWK